MRKINKEVDPQYLNCPIRNVIDKFGDKWSLLVLYQLHDKGTLRFYELHREMADCSQKMLSQTLKRLEQIGLISRTLYPEVPPRVEYCLTARGQSLMPHVSALIGWALEHFEEIAK
ncbi:MAG: helix-turn-helix transcriptional regulator [Paludibacteraceae bacterium]|nr:helix-turn-helix transcriptional regulator [Paludibacteraceae bacterium]